MLIVFLRELALALTLIGLLAFFLDSPNVHLGYDSRMCQACQDKYQNRKFISATTHRSRKLAVSVRHLEAKVYNA
jgi:hypothetical protein